VVVIDSTESTVSDSTAVMLVLATDVAVMLAVVLPGRLTGAWYVTEVFVGLSNVPPPLRLQVTPSLLGSFPTAAAIAWLWPSLIVIVDVVGGVSVMVRVELDEHPDQVSAQAKLASASSTRSLNFATAFLLTWQKV